MAYKSPVYNWSLRGGAPSELIVKPTDPWPGKSDAARMLCAGAFVMGGNQLGLRGDCWEPFGVDEVWLAHMHGFSWLRDLRTMGGDTARKQARAMVESWIEQYNSWHDLPWRSDILGQRVSMWIALYDFFGESASTDFQEQYFDSLIRQARHLSRTLLDGAYGIGLLYAVKGLLYAGLAFEGYESWVEQALDLLKIEVKAQILGDGAHVSRAPMPLLEALQILLDIRSALAAARYPLPEYVQHAIDRMGPALRFYRYNDKHFALFNGAIKGDTALVDFVLNQANVRGKGLQSLSCVGYERMALGRTMIMFDGGASPPWPHDACAHAAPLAFEMCYGRERMFVSCGSHISDASWRDSLRATAAHCTLGLDYRNACEISESGHFLRKVGPVEIVREENKEAILVEASHDGYVPLNGMVHRRRLYLSEDGHDLRGEDTLVSSIGASKESLGKEIDIAVRFHLHPKVMVSLVQEGTEALLRLPSGVGWRFSHSAGVLALEDSVYLGDGTHPRKTKQLVIYGRSSEAQAQIKWRVSREG